jgi:hypothetical protein
MRICTTLVAICAFALHLMLGCCWHHAHGQDELPGHDHATAGQHVHLPQWLTPVAAPSTAPSTEKCSGHSHSHSGQPDHHHHTHDSAPVESAPSQDSPVTPHAPCADPQCVYVATTQIEAPAAHNIAIPFVLIVQLAVPQTSLTSVYDLTPHEECPPHLRRHLALSRLLN